MAYGLIQPLQSAQQRQAQQNDGVVDLLGHAQPHSRLGVVGRALVARQIDAIGEFGRHLVAMTGHMPHLPCGQPHAHGQVGQQQNNENQGEEGGRGHGRV